MSKVKKVSIIIFVFLFILNTLIIMPGTVLADTTGVRVHSSNRYFMDAQGNPMFLLGLYAWTGMDPNKTDDLLIDYRTVIDTVSDYDLNYVRTCVSFNRDLSIGNPTPYYYDTSVGKYDLDQWDPSFWNGLKALCTYADSKGVIVHVSIFEGCSLKQKNSRPPELMFINYSDSFYNLANQ